MIVEAVMKVGDLVKRKSIWEPWLAVNPSWQNIDLPEDAIKFGIIILYNDNKPMILWSDGKLEKEFIDNIEVISESW
jgi:hypothetical protein